MKKTTLGVVISLTAEEQLKVLKDLPMWTALREYMREYIKLQKDLAWRLNETDDKFNIRHAQFTSKATAFNDLINFIERDVRRESQQKPDDKPVS